MPMYGVAILLLIDIPEIQSLTRNCAQVASSLKSVQSLQNILDKVNDYDCAFG